MERFKLGFIGAGFIANFHATALASVRGVDLVGVHALKGAEDLAAFSKEQGLGECVVYETVGELCKHCDAVAVFAPNFVRIELVEQIVEAVRAGAPLKGIICEKPLGRNMKEALRLVALAKESGLPTSYYENQNYMKMVTRTLEQLAPQQRAMGPITLARASEEHAGPHMGWFWDPTRQGGGALLDMGCHTIAANWCMLTPVGKPALYLQPTRISANTELIKWGQPQWRADLLDRMGVDYGKTPAEDYATGMITYRHPDTGQEVKSQFNASWMYDKQGMRMHMDGLAPGYAYEINTLMSPLNLFVGDAAANAVADGEAALQKATATRGLLAVIPNEADTYGYTDELLDAVTSFRAGKDAAYNWEYGAEVTRLCMAGYMSAERGQTIDLTDPAIQKELETFVPLIQQGKGAEVLHVR